MAFSKEDMIGIEDLKFGEIYIMLDDSPADGGIGVNKFIYVGENDASFLSTLSDESETNWIDQTFPFNDYIGRKIFFHVNDRTGYLEYDGSYYLTKLEEDIEEWTSEN